MLPLLRKVFVLGICTSVGLMAIANHVTAQEDVAAESSESSTLDTGFLFDGGNPTSVEQLKYMQDHFVEISERVKAATVNIQIGASQGTGIVVSSDGYILTAAHVIGNPEMRALVSFTEADGTEKAFKAKRVMAKTLGVDAGVDSGMLKIDIDEDDEGFEEFPYLDIAISDDLKEGQWVMAVGHPGGIDLDRGLVVRVGRIIYKTNRVISTDCTLVGGDSGGPLVDMNGDVIGIHSRIGGQLVDNLHVPVDVYTENWDLMSQGVKLDGKPSLGFAVLEETNKIERITKRGAFDKAGVKKSDQLIKIGGVKVEDKEDIFNAIKNRLKLRPNMKTKVVVMRDGEEVELEVKVGDANPPKRIAGRLRRPPVDPNKEEDKKGEELKDDKKKEDKKDDDEDKEEGKDDDEKDDDDEDGNEKKTDDEDDKKDDDK